jgi:hypothetical protein
MQLGGPVWHASAAPVPGWPANEQFLKQCALTALQGVGDESLGQWEEWTGQAYHIRRRLTRKEQQSVGEPKDIRNTPEADKRHKAVQRYLPAQYKNWKE